MHTRSYTSGVMANHDQVGVTQQGAYLPHSFSDGELSSFLDQLDGRLTSAQKLHVADRFAGKHWRHVEKQRNVSTRNFQKRPAWLIVWLMKPLCKSVLVRRCQSSQSFSSLHRTCATNAWHFAPKHHCYGALGFKWNLL
eukprot:6204012-Pleurochrysis_carterae.AAC.4